MKDSMLLGLALGFIAGALIVTHNKKVEEIVDKSKKSIKEQVKKMVD